MLKAETREERGISSHLGMMQLKILNGERDICIEFCKSVENRIRAPRGEVGDATLYALQSEEVQPLGR